MNKTMLASILGYMAVVPPGDGNSTIELTYATLEEIPANVVDLYTEKDGKYHLTGVNGIKTIDDVNRLTQALAKERKDHGQVKQLVTSLSSHGTVEEIVAKLDRIPVLEAGQGNKPEDIEKIVSARLAPLQRKLDEATTAIGERDGIIQGYKGKEQSQTIAGAVRKAAKTLKIRDSAVEDAILYGEKVLTIDESGNVVTKENINGVMPFITVSDMLRDLIPTRPHWLEESFGGGASGGKGGGNISNDPYSYEGWNVTEQMKLFNSDRAKAEKLAQRNGVDPLKPVRPAKKS